MVNFFDTLMIRVGFDSDELEEVRLRGILYPGILAMLGLCLCGLTLLLS